MPLHSAVITRGFIALLSVALLSACDNAAQWAYQNGLEFEISRAGLQEETITTDDGIQWHLLVSESSTSAPPVLLIHGFGADASNWVRFAGNLEEEFYFVVPDLPGHGDSTRDLGLDYTMKAQAKRLLTLMDTLQIEQFHVAGNSMGGAITLEMARQAPQRVLSMGLVDSAGLTRQTPEFKALLEGSDSNPLIPHSRDEFQTTLEWAMEEPPYMPDFFMDVMGQRKAENAVVAEDIFRQLGTDPGMNLENSEVLATLDQATLVMWGKEDRLLGVDNVPVFLERLPRARSVILDGIGHLPMTEAPAKSADAFRTFWNENRP
ncbi:alpha/beta fold hydrolase [Alcanivorax profundi]|jgi:pimeloyl-ACP methyl ester carboxylesterase|uniref:Alpha/beta fold hydrolase n=1 Tax=Alcanivorax profundi TaxID=2338368 RepID=A0A418Y3J2_9GAMM|nr:alpha/beta fold hydrolase [Alcanivorax profundi]RJG20109.1 alpha/beta fold hydrolase [Alcanivorax profundi]